VIAPRYGNPITQGKLAPHQVPENDLEVRYPFEFSIDIRGALANASISSPSHPIGVRHALNESGPCIKVSLGANASLDRDLVINLSELHVDSLAVLAADMADIQHTASLLSFCPSISKGMKDDIAVKFLVDCSGSMSGDSIQAARRSLQAILAQLKTGDQFSLSKFGDAVDHRSRSLWSLKEATTVGAQRWISDLEADMGGTEMESALSSTFNISAPENSVVFLITDGEVYDIDRLIETAAKSGHRIFVIGIGSSPTEANLRRLAEVTGGSCDFVAPGEAVEPAILRMFARLRSPRAQSLEIQWPDGMKPLWETPLPKSAFDSDTINLFALWPEAPHGEVKLIAQIDGHSASVPLATLKLSNQQSKETSLSRVAASRHLTTLVESQAESMAVNYQLVTPHTNFLLIHERAEDEKALDMPDLIKVKQMLPAGWGGVGSAHRHDVCYSMRSSSSKVMKCVDTSSSYDLDLIPSKRRSKASDSSDTSRLHASIGRGNHDIETEYLDVPAFLRRSDLKEYYPEIVLDDERPVTLVEWLISHDRRDWPMTFKQLEELGVSAEVILWIRIQADQDHWNSFSEEEIIAAFLEALPQMPVFSSRIKKGLLQEFIARVRGEYRHRPLQGDSAFTQHMADNLKDLQSDHWGKAISEVFDCMA
jgi:Ca-activated chloride channel family protein